MKYYHINEDFLDELRNHERRIPLTNYGTESWKPFFGALFEVDDLVYVTNLSSPKHRHEGMRAQLDFIKLYISDEPNPDRFIAVINLNYMFPVPKRYLTEVDYQVLKNLMPDKSEDNLSKYWDFLMIELDALESSKTLENARKVYEMKCNFPENRISMRCFDFKELERIVLNIQIDE